MALRLILGFDYGTKQIGVAVGQVITGQARELCTLKAVSYTHLTLPTKA